MPYISQDFINNKLLPSVDIIQVVSQFLTLERKGNEYICCCPFHQEKTPSFHVRATQQYFHCFGCNASGDVITFLRKYKNLSYPEAIEELAKFAGIEVEYEKGSFTTHTASGDDLYYEVLDRLAAYFTQQLYRSPKALEYCRKSRQLNEDTIVKARLGYAPNNFQYLLQEFAQSENDQKVLQDVGLLKKSEKSIYGNQPHYYAFFHNRVVFPICNVRGKVIGFGARLLEGDGPKYLNSAESLIFHKRKELFGLYETIQAHNNRPDCIVLVEGYMDVIALRQAGIDYTVASLGTATTVEQFTLLFRYTKKVICCYDGDNAGRKAAWHALETAWPLLKETNELRFATVPGSYDPDSLVREQGREAFEALLAQSLSVPDFILDYKKRQFNLDDMNQLASLTNSVVSVCKAMYPSAHALATLKALAKEFTYSEQSVQELMYRSDIQPDIGFKEHNQQRPYRMPYASGQQDVPPYAPAQMPSSRAGAGNPAPYDQSNYVQSVAQGSSPAGPQNSYSNQDYVPFTQSEPRYSSRYGRGYSRGQRPHRSWLQEKEYKQQFPERYQSSRPRVAYSEQKFFAQVNRSQQQPQTYSVEQQPISGDVIVDYNPARMPQFDKEEVKKTKKEVSVQDTHLSEMMDKLSAAFATEAVIPGPRELEDLNKGLTPQEYKYRTVVGSNVESMGSLNGEVYYLLHFILHMPTTVKFAYTEFNLEQFLRFAQALALPEFPVLQRLILNCRYMSNLTTATLLNRFEGTEFSTLLNFIYKNKGLERFTLPENQKPEDAVHSFATLIFSVIQQAFTERIQYLNNKSFYAQDDQVDLQEMADLCAVVSCRYDNASLELDKRQRSQQKMAEEQRRLQQAATTNPAPAVAAKADPENTILANEERGAYEFSEAIVHMQG